MQVTTTAYIVYLRCDVIIQVERQYQGGDGAGTSTGITCIVTCIYITCIIR